MPLDPQRVQAIFLEAASYCDPTDRAQSWIANARAIPSCGSGSRRILNAHDRFKEFVNQPLDGQDGQATCCYLGSDSRRSGMIE